MISSLVRSQEERCPRGYKKMPWNVITIHEMEEDATTTKASEYAAVSRTERRKAGKKEKRMQKRKETAVITRQEEEAWLNDPGEQLRLKVEEEMEKKRTENERMEFEARERMIQEAWARKRALEEEKEEMRRKDWEEQQSRLVEVGYEKEADEDECECEKEVPPEIIWQGNEIIVKKKKVRVKKKDPDHLIVKEDPNRPISNPLPPQSEAFADYKSASIPSAQQLLENFAQLQILGQSRIKLTVHSISKQGLVGLAHVAAEFTFTLISPAPFLSKTCTMALD